jgi:hypothetical protein
MEKLARFIVILGYYTPQDIKFVPAFRKSCLHTQEWLDLVQVDDKVTGRREYGFNRKVAKTVANQSRQYNREASYPQILQHPPAKDSLTLRTEAASSIEPWDQTLSYTASEFTHPII